MNPFKLALRRLVSVPGFSLAAIVSLTLGIGANSLAFGALQGLLVRPMPFTDGDSVTWVFARSAADRPGVEGKVSSHEARALAERMSSFSAVAVIGDKSLIVEGTGRLVQWHGLWVTPDLFRVLDVTPAAGRPLDVRDMRPGGPPAMMLGHERWTKDFGSDPAVIGRVVSFADDKHFTVVGVLPAGLEFPLGRPPQSGNGAGFTPGPQDFWVLGQDDPRAYPGGTLLARLAPGATLQSAGAEARTIAAAIASELPDRNDARTFELVTLRDQLLGVLAPALPLTQAFAALVLLIAGANLANLMFVRAISVEHDGAVRLALGGTRRQVIMPLLAEGVLLCGAGSACGLLLAWIAQHAVRNALSSYPSVAERVEISGSVLLFGVLLSLVTTVGCVLVPAAARVRVSPSALLGRNDARQLTPRGRRWRGTLVMTQVALALVLVVGASLLGNSLHRLTSIDAGYYRDQVVAADVQLYVSGREVYAFLQHAVPRLRALPGVEAVGLIHSTPLTGKWTFAEPFAVEGRAAPAHPPLVSGNFVAFDYFGTMKIPVVAGRTFTDRDLLAPGRKPVIINDVAAGLFFPGEDPVGRRVTLGGRSHEIVGIVKGTRDVGLDVPAAAQWYQPAFFGSSQILVRVAGDPSRFVEVLRAELLAADPRLIVARVEPLEAIASRHLSERRTISQLLTGFALIAFVLATVGLYGVMHASAVQRKREFGLRVALGARPRDILQLVLRQGLVLAASGIAIGIGVAFAGAGLLRNLLFETSPTEPGVFAGASLLVLLVSAAASLAPARRAATADPIGTLRSE